MTNSTASIKRIVRISSVSLLFSAVALLPSVTPHAQRATKEPSPKVTGINSRKTANGEVISISTDKPINGTQTWQDPDGKFHLIVPGAGESSVKSTGGVKVRRVGDSLEIEVPARPGTNVTVQPGSNRLDLVVKGGLNQSPSSTDDIAPAQGQSAREKDDARATNARTPRGTTPANAKQEEAATTEPAPAAVVEPTVAGVAQSNVPLIIPAQADNAAVTPPATQTNSATPPSAARKRSTKPAKASGIFSYIFSMTGIAIFLALGLVAAWVFHRRRHSWEDVEEVRESATTALTTTTTANSIEERTGERRKKSRGRRGNDQQIVPVKAASNVMQNVESNEQTLEIRSSGLAPAALFGAYRVDQEIGKLILGQPHRMDVLASRASDDRRAMETSLLKALNAPDADEDTCRRARQALEEYGFVARQSAALLLAPDDYERASAARMLGEVGSESALPFLLEALYDTETAVRTQAVASLGELKMPSAIGALLDMARRYPEMPSSLLSRVLSDCSIECLDIFGTSTPERAFLSLGSGEPFSGEITRLEPSSVVDELPEWMEDEALEDALASLQSQDVEARIAAAQSLASYQVQRSVAALTMLAAEDPEPSVRAAAVSSLGTIDHESVFAPVLIAFADEAREVRAVAARALSRLNFDRADAYVRVMETADAETLRAVASACIKAEMASQAIDRLASEDRRQAYEAFSLLSMLAKTNQVELLIEAIDQHHDTETRLATVRLLGLAGQPEIVPQLRQLTVRDGVPEKVRMALLEVVYKMDQMQPV